MKWKTTQKTQIRLKPNRVDAFGSDFYVGPIEIKGMEGEASPEEFGELYEGGKGEIGVRFEVGFCVDEDSGMMSAEADSRYLLEVDAYPYNGQIVHDMDRDAARLLGEKQRNSILIRSERAIQEFFEASGVEVDNLDPERYRLLETVAERLGRC